MCRVSEWHGPRAKTSIRLSGIKKRARAEAARFLAEKSFRLWIQRVLRDGDGIRLADPGFPRKCCEEPAQVFRLNVADDENDPGRMIRVRPGVEPLWRMEDMLHAVDDDRPGGIVG